MTKDAFLNWCRPMLARAAEIGSRLTGRVDRYRAQALADEWRGVRHRTAALGLVAAAVLIRFATGWTAPPLWLFHLAVATAALAWGFPAAAVAALATTLAARTIDGAPWPAVLLFLAEALIVAGVIVRLASALRAQQRRARDADRALLEMKAVERQARIVDAALSRLDEAAADCAIVVLDSTGRIADWRAGATALYGRERASLVGASAALLFGEGSDAEFGDLLSAARRGPVRHQARQQRANGHTFEAELELRPLSRGGLDGFALVVHDLTGQQARDAMRLSADQAFARLQEEADIAHRQLAALQHVTDPALNSLDSDDFITTLLERLRTAIDAEGIALVRLGRFRRRVFCAEGGLQCVRGVAAPLTDLSPGDPARTLMIHNDAAAVTESSAAVWPTGVSSLMAVPVVRAGTRQAIMEVVNGTGRRATEWEIALVQVVAARIAGFLRDDPYADAGAVA